VVVVVMWVRVWVGVWVVVTEGCGSDRGIGGRKVAHGVGAGWVGRDG